MPAGRAGAARGVAGARRGVPPAAAVRFVQADDPAIQPSPNRRARGHRRGRSGEDREAEDAAAGGPVVSVTDEKPIEYATPRDLRDPTGTGSPLLRVRDLRTYFPIK